MFAIQDILISDDIIDSHFLCQLSVCKGACCVEGDNGAPLEEDEKELLPQIYPKIKHLLSIEGQNAIDKNGTHYMENDEPYTMLTYPGGPCALISYDEMGIAKCGIEKAYHQGLIEFQKPISCHLYPIRVTLNEVQGFEALNYDRWDICNPACSAGKKGNLKLYAFLKDPLIRKYGEAWYEELNAYAQWVEEENKNI
jgi:hypothetical protein